MLKNLATCKPSEFLAQTNKIRKIVEKWLENTNIMKIRQIKPEFPEDASVEERQEILQNHVKKNLSMMLDAILERNSEESLELLALLCFVEPKDVDKHEVAEYLESITALISNKTVLSFFTSLAQLGQMNT